MPSTAHYRLRQKDSEGHCRCSDHTGPPGIGWPNQARSYTARCRDLGWAAEGDEHTVTVPAGTFHASTLAAANTLALNSARQQAQALLSCDEMLISTAGPGGCTKVKCIEEGRPVAIGGWKAMTIYHSNAPQEDFWSVMMMRLNVDGTFDYDFRTFLDVPLCKSDGELIVLEDLGIGEGAGQLHDFAVDAGGNIIVVGDFYMLVSGVVYNGVARFSSAGVWDPTFLCRFSASGDLGSASVRTVQVINATSIIFAGIFTHYAKAGGGFGVAINLVNVDQNRTALYAAQITTVYFTLWNVWCSCFSQGRLYLGTENPGFEFGGGSGPPPSDLNVAGGGVFKIELNGSGRVTGYRCVTTIPFFGENHYGRVLSLDMDRSGNLYAVGLIGAIGRVPILSGYYSNEVARVNTFKISATGTVDTVWKPRIYLPDFPFGISQIRVLPDRGLMVAGGGFYMVVAGNDPINARSIARFNPSGVLIGSTPEGMIQGPIQVFDLSTDGYVYVVAGYAIGTGGIFGIGSIIQRFHLDQFSPDTVDNE